MHIMIVELNSDSISIAGGEEVAHMSLHIIVGFNIILMIYYVLTHQVDLFQPAESSHNINSLYSYNRMHNIG